MGEAWSNQLIQLLILSLPGGFTGIFGYSPSPGPGNLVISITAQAGTDPFGNPYPAGVCVGPSSGPQVNITGGNPAAVTFPLNDPAFAVSPTMQGGTSAPPPTVNRFAQLLIDGPKLPAGPHDDYGEMQINSPNADGSSAASVALVYYDANGAQNGYFVIDNRGIFAPVVNTLIALRPGTGTSVTNPGQPETWHDMRPLQNSFIGTNAGFYPPQYRLLADGNVQVYGSIRLPATAANYNNITFFTMPAFYRPSANDGARWLITNVADGSSGPVVQVDTSGNLQFHFMPASLGGTLINISGIYPLDGTGIIQS